MAGERAFVDINVKRALLREYLMNEVKRAGFGGAEIQRTPMGTRVTLITERPGLVIGRKGDSIKAITDAIQFDFGFDKPQVEVVEIDNPNLSAQIMSEKLASALERGWHFRRAGHSTVRRIMDNGARGCQVIISGKLTGQRHRTEKFKEGHIKFCGEPKLLFMEEGFTPAKLKLGIIGVKVQIMHPNARLPDEVKIRDPATMAPAQAEVPEPAPADVPADAPAEPAAKEKQEKQAPQKKKKSAPRPKTEDATEKPEPAIEAAAETPAPAKEEKKEETNTEAADGTIKDQ
ncbi:MAG: 30S ribosomal protein S3 [Thermoplasmata archaeon]